MIAAMVLDGIHVGRAPGSPFPDVRSRHTIAHRPAAAATSASSLSSRPR